VSESEKDLGLSWNWTDHHCPSLVALVGSYRDCDNLITIFVSRNTLLRVWGLSLYIQPRTDMIGTLIGTNFGLAKIDLDHVAKNFGENVRRGMSETGEDNFAALLSPILNWTVFENLEGESECPEKDFTVSMLESWSNRQQPDARKKNSSMKYFAQ